MINYIKDFQGEDIYSFEQIDKVSEYLKNLDKKILYKVKYDIKQIMQDFIDVMQAIEDDKMKSMNIFEKATLKFKEIIKTPQITFLSGFIFGTAITATAEYVLFNNDNAPKGR